MAKGTEMTIQIRALDLLGEFLMTKVRDETISDWKMIIDGRMKGDRAARVRRLIQDLSDQQVSVLDLLVRAVVDSVLHQLLWGLEETNDIRISVTVDNQTIQNLNEVSDGLSGELYSDDGWIARFSREKEN